MNTELMIVEAPSVLPLLRVGGVAANPLASEFAAESDGVPMTKENDLPVVRIDHANGRFTIHGQPIGERIEGYLLHYYQQRSYWEKSYKAGQSTPPDCASIDTVVPVVNAPKPMAPSCAECKMSTYGSGPNNSQACRVNTWMFLLNPKEFPPHGVASVVFPPSSIKAMLGTQRAGGGFVGKAKQFREPGGPPAQFYQIVWSRFTLENGDGPFCVLRGEPLAVPKEAGEAKAIASIRKGLMAVFDAMRGRVEQGDVEG